jgi:branched-chain amino acid transport system substrate-binding protein
MKSLESSASSPTLHLRRAFMLGVSSALVLGQSRFTLAADTKRPIVIGQSVDLSGPLRGFGEQLTSGLSAAITSANKAGGINGRMISLMTLDDKFSVAATEENVRQLVQQKQAIALLCPTGTPSALAQARLATELQVPLIGPGSGSGVLAKYSDWVFTTRARLRTEIEAIIQHGARIGVKTIGIVYGDNAGGKEALAHATALAKEQQVNLIVSAAIKDDLSNASEAAANVSNLKPNIVILACTAGAAIAYLRVKTNAVAHYGISFVNPAAVYASLKEKGAGLVVAQVTPSPQNILIPVVSAFAFDMKASQQTLRTHASLEGYIAGRVLIRALKNLPETNTGLGLVKGLRATKMDLGGIDINFTNSEVGGSRFVELTMLKSDGRLAI